MQNNTAETAPKRERTALYTLARIIFGFLFHTIFPLRFHNAQIADEMQPPYIIMANHRSFADPMALAIKVKKYEIRFIGKRELAKGKLKNWLFSGLHMILVSRHATDMAAMRQCMQTLKEGHILGIFPEGTRHHGGTMEQLESGVGLIALRSGAPVVPMYIESKYRLFHRNRCVVGAPIDYSDLRAEGVNRDTCQRLMERITEVYVRLREKTGKK